MKWIVTLLLFWYIGTVTAAGREMTISIQQAKEKHTARLMAQPGVVSIGIGRSSEGETAIIIGLDGTHPETATTLPKELEGYKVISRTIGQIKTQ